VHKRILFGLVAWLLGAATATAGSLLAVSLLGQGIGGGPARQLTEEAVNRALASEVAETTSPASPAPPATSRTTPPTVHPAAKPTRPSATATPDPPPSQSATSTPSPASTGGTSSPGGTVFTSKGGEVVASCQTSGAYLLSWSPLQGYEVGYVVRGPAAAARVTFEANDRSNLVVTMVVTCSAGVPSATTSSRYDE
jgi:hypothetical protein